MVGVVWHTSGSHEWLKNEAPTHTPRPQRNVSVSVSAARGLPIPAGRSPYDTEDRHGAHGTDVQRATGAQWSRREERDRIAPLPTTEHVGKCRHGTGPERHRHGTGMAQARHRPTRSVQLSGATEANRTWPTLPDACARADGAARAAGGAGRAGRDTVPPPRLGSRGSGVGLPARGHGVCVWR